MNPEKDLQYEEYLKHKKKKFTVLGKFCENFAIYKHHSDKIYESLHFQDTEGDWSNQNVSLIKK